MSVSKTVRVLGMVLLGASAVFVTSAALLIVQVQNADNACESFPAGVPGADYSDVRDLGFKNSYLNLGGKCVYYLDDGSAVKTREPGQWFSGSLMAIAAAAALLTVYLVRRKGHSGWLFGLLTFVNTPLGLLLALVVRRKVNRGAAAP